MSVSRSPDATSLSSYSSPRNYSSPTNHALITSSSLLNDGEGGNLLDFVEQVHMNEIYSGSSPPSSCSFNYDMMNDDPFAIIEATTKFTGDRVYPFPICQSCVGAEGSMYICALYLLGIDGKLHSSRHNAGTSCEGMIVTHPRRWEPRNFNYKVATGLTIRNLCSRIPLRLQDDAPKLGKELMLMMMDGVGMASVAVSQSTAKSLSITTAQDLQERIGHGDVTVVLERRNIPSPSGEVRP